MRLIDADALIEQMESDAEETPLILLKMAYHAAINDVKHQPIIEERKKGKWDDIGCAIRWGCPICHHAYETKYNFCPTCGADMRGNEK